MPDAITQIRSELDSINYTTSEFDGPHGRVVSFDYTIETGSHRGELVTVGLSFQGETNYPEYPPHWVHISPPINDGRGGSVQSYESSDGKQWLAMSRPPGEMWDRLRTKHISLFISEHLRRIWMNV